MCSQVCDVDCVCAFSQEKYLLRLWNQHRALKAALHGHWPHPFPQNTRSIELP